MNQILKKQAVLILMSALGLVLVSLVWTGPAAADGGGWPTPTYTLSPTNVQPTSPMDQFFTPEPVIIVPDTGGSSTSFENQMATMQVEIQQTSTAQAIMLQPTAVPAASNGGISPIFMVVGLVISIGVLAFLVFRLLRR